MRNFKSIVIVFSLIIMMPSCKIDSNKKNEQRNSNKKIDNNNIVQTISTDIDSLGELLDFTTYKPIKVKYKYTFIDNSGKNDRISVPGPSDYYLEALMYFDSLTFSEINDFEKELEGVKQNHKKEAFNFEWLPNEVKNELMKSNVEYHGRPDFFFGIGVHRKSWYLKNKILIKTSSI